MTVLAATFARVIPAIHKIAAKHLINQRVIPISGNPAHATGKIIDVTFGARGEVMLGIAISTGDGIWNLDDVAFVGETHADTARA